MNRKIEISPELQRLLDATPNTDGIAESIQEDFKGFERDPEFVADFLKMQFVEDIYHAMADKKLKPAALAKLMGVERQYVTRVLNEKANFTFETLAKIACALDMHVAARLYARGEYLAIRPVVKNPQLIAYPDFVPEDNPMNNALGENDAGHLAA